MGQELSTGRTVTNTSTGQSRRASGTLQNSSSDIDLTQQIAEYFVGMMRLQMMSRVSTLGLGSSLGSTDLDGSSLW